MEKTFEINWGRFQNPELLKKIFEESILELNQKAFISKLDIPNVEIVLFQFDKIFGMIVERESFNNNSKIKILENEIKNCQEAISKLEMILSDDEKNLNSKVVAINFVKKYKDEVSILEEMKNYKNIQIKNHGELSHHPLDTFFSGALKIADTILKSVCLNTFAKERFRNIANLAINDSSLLDEISKMVGDSNDFGKKTKSSLGKN